MDLQKDFKAEDIMFNLHKKAHKAVSLDAKFVTTVGDDPYFCIVVNFHDSVYDITKESDYKRLREDINKRGGVDGGQEDTGVDNDYTQTIVDDDLNSSIYMQTGDSDTQTWDMI